ncbi:homoserine O-acetyltransferase MetX [Curtobacterium flaccumfaciens]|uniref:homoserine O-acetyltransferase MetX n=1 Tax=Curtobacterium flaccumfaciens TaxID=2035 RepID=UPI001BDE4B27|nr:homoserine O-acetyltransferase [Curtobacterium flaccumfaciens]MBT1607752.1 homoserine O-acetyltransferase [Curtobacterium flaccumfaciens pv. betae]MBT1658126.1 homoserine O-acetyltransferase [Curtobacterium flaccumfaciens pv. betae]MCS0472480.1 homoserine O-acetyltransferase [Curtobacterium flaccumfaciens pv. betae]MCS0474613.1 homoserine O-acetyltransferase [Curtobacterium flaccumfaciens pv. betae]MCS0479220.1 homoserine O-acetyltransferase [Curtobacterium flaccumfaciens pv. betae]
MDWQTTPEDSVPSTLVPGTELGTLGKPPVTGAWRPGDHPGARHFESLGEQWVRGGRLPSVRVAYETWGTLNAARDNAVLVLHALTGDSHVAGDPGPGHRTAGWWGDVVGPGRAIDTDRWFVIAPNMLGGCQGTTGPSSVSPSGAEWGARFPFVTVRDQVEVQAQLADRLGIETFAAVVGGSMGGMHALEFAVSHPARVQRLAVLASTAQTTADQIAANSLQRAAIQMDPAFAGGDYFEAEVGEGPHRGLSLARRMALMTYRASDELNSRFARSWQSDVSPLGDDGRFSVESYLDFHGNKFTRRFDASSYVTLTYAMDSHDVGAGRGGVSAALGLVTARTLVVGISSDRLFPVEDQHRIAAGVPDALDGDTAAVIESEFGHDGFLIEHEQVGAHLRRLLES